MVKFGLPTLKCSMSQVDSAEIELMQRAHEESVEVDESARERLKSDSYLTLLRLNYWQWDLDIGAADIIFGEQKLTLGKAVACIFANTITRVDDYFDTHRGNYQNMNASNLKTAISETDVDPELDEGRGAGVKVKEVFGLVEDFIGTLPSGQRREEALKLMSEFRDRTFLALAWEVSVDKSKYTHNEAMLCKINTLETFYGLIYTLGAEKKYDEREREKISRLLTVAQLDDDNRDFDEDLTQGNVNVAVGFYNEIVSKGIDNGIAKQRALQKSKLLSGQMKLATGYYLVGIQIIISRFLSMKKGLHS